LRLDGGRRDTIIVDRGAPMMDDDWPRLELREWEPTYKTLHRWLQVVGKIKTRFAAPLNHWWHVTLFLTPHGLTTLTVPQGPNTLEIAFDVVEHRLIVRLAGGRSAGFALEPMSVAAFYERTMATLRELGIDASIWPVPVEMTDPIPFPDDREHCAYDAGQVARVHRVLLSVGRVFAIHRGRFFGKSSPVHFFWGAFDLAVTRFSGRPNPSPPDDKVNGPAYSHEVISHGFWPGGDWPAGGRIDEAVLYAYSVPEPPGFATAKVEPAAARYHQTLHEFLLPYEAVRRARDPEEQLLRFMESTYRAGARAGDWPLLSCDDPLALGRGGGAAGRG
jgi:hypothetical protein